MPIHVQPLISHSLIGILWQRFFNSAINASLFFGEIFILPKNVVLLKISSPSLDDNILCPVKIAVVGEDRKSTRLNSSHVAISYAVFCLKKKTKKYKI